MLNFALKLEDANYKSHWNILVFCGQRKMMSDLNMPLGKMPNFILFLLFGLTLIIKLRNFDFESHWNTLMFFDKRRYGVRFEYVPWKNVWVCFISDFWVHFSQKIEKFWFWKSLKYILKDDARFEYVLPNIVCIVLSVVVWVWFWQLVEKYGF